MMRMNCAKRFVLWSPGRNTASNCFEYAKPAIQYNIISYMLKPLTLDGLIAELRIIRKKIDAQFALFRQAEAQEAAQDKLTPMLMPLVLDDYAEAWDDLQAEAYGRECGLLRDELDKPCYTVMVSTLLDKAGGKPYHALFCGAG